MASPFLKIARNRPDPINGGASKGIASGGKGRVGEAPFVEVEVKGWKREEIAKCLKASYPDVSDKTLEQMIHRARRDGVMQGRFVWFPDGAMGRRMGDKTGKRVLKSLRGYNSVAPAPIGRDEKEPAKPVVSEKPQLTKAELSELAAKFEKDECIGWLTPTGTFFPALPVDDRPEDNHGLNRHDAAGLKHLRLMPDGKQLAQLTSVRDFRGYRTWEETAAIGLVSDFLQKNGYRKIG